MDEKELKYTETHEWVSIDGEVATIGITNFAQEQLGDITFVNIEDVDTEVEKNSECGTIDSVKTVSDVMAPMSGEIAEINSQLEDKPELVNQDPFGDGWLLKIKISTPSEADELMNYDKYQKHVADAEH